MRYVAALILCASFFMPSVADAARLWTSGIELNDALIEFGDTSGTVSVSTTQVRTGTYALRSNPTTARGDADINLGTGIEGADVYARFYLYIASTPSANTPIFEFTNDSAYTICGLQLKTDRTLQLYVYTDTGTPSTAANHVGSPSTALSTDTWYRIEVACNRTAGGNPTSASARIDGTQFASGSKTVNSGSNGIRRVFFGVDVTGWGQTATADLYFDDIAINDTSGASQTSFPGSGRVAISRPNAVGDNQPDSCNDIACSGGGTGGYLQIDETTPDNSTSFIDLDTATSIGDFGMQNASTIGIDSYDTVSLVDIGIALREELSAATLYTPRIKSASGGTVLSLTAADAGNTTWRLNPTGTTEYSNRLVSYTDPTTGIAWTPTGTNSIDNMQAGVASTDADDIDVTMIYAYVEFVDGSAVGTEKMRARLNGGRVKISGGRIKLQSN